MPSCPACGLRFAHGERFCPADGSKLPAETDPPATDDPLVGKIVDGRYRILSKIGEGGMGTVYRAMHVHMDKLFALKILRPSLSVEATAVKRFQREAKSASLLDHEHCIRVSDFGYTEGVRGSGSSPDVDPYAAGGLLYLAMEHLEGRTLGDELHQVGSLAPRRAMSIALQTAQALAHAQDLGLIHRDLKPDNIFLLRREGNPDFVKVLDFGLAKLLERDAGDDPHRTALTEHGVVFGTPEYMSPEQAEGRPLDAQTDLYSLGICVYHMLTGQLPFQAPTYMSILTKHIVEAPISPAEKRPDLGLPASLVDVVMRCLEKDPSRRPAGARALADLLVACDLPPAPAAVPGAPRVPAAIASHPTIDVKANGEADGKIEVQTGVTASVTVSRRGTVLGVAVSLVVLVAVVLGAGAILRRRPGPAAAPPPPDAAASVVPVANSTEQLDSAPPAPDAASAPGPPPRTREGPRDMVADRLNKAAGFRKRGDRIQERVQLQRALEIDPNNAEAHFLLGEGALADGNPDLACKHLKRASSLKKAKTLYEKAECDLVTP